MPTPARPETLGAVGWPPPTDGQRAGDGLGAPDLRRRWWVGTLVVATCGALLMTGSVLIAAAPAVVAGVAAVAWRLPLRYPVAVLVFAALAVFSPPTSKTGELMASGPLWDGLLRPANDVLSIYLNRLTGIGVLSLTGTELVYVLFALLILTRWTRDVRIDAVGRVPGTNALYAACGLGLAAVMFLAAWGPLTGGDPRSSLFQFRHLLFIFVMAGVFSYALRDLRDFATIGRVATGAVVVKIALGLYFLSHDARARGVEPEFMTGHHDSVLYTSVLFAWAAAWLHGRRKLRRLLPTLLVCGWVGLGVVANDRRIAYVSIFGSMLALYALQDRAVRRGIMRRLVWALPVLLAYVMLAKTHTGGIFKPAAQLWSVGDQADPSNTFREAENINLMITLAARKVFGWGWGHEYIEALRLPDISRMMPQYRLTPHNSILWLLGVGGVVWFPCLWMPFVVAIFLAARSYIYAATPSQRTGAATALAILVAFVNQAWGDMGTQGSVIPVAFALALAGKLARSTGAWPSSAHLAGSSGAANRAGAPADARPHSLP